MHLKRHLRLRATAATRQKAQARRQALRALETDSRAAQAQHKAKITPADKLKKPSGVLDTQQDPRRGKLLLHGK